MYVGAGGTHVRCIYDGGTLLEWNAEWKCMFKYWDPRKYKSKEFWSRYYKIKYSIVKNISLHQVVPAYNYSLCDWKVQVKF